MNREVLRIPQGRETENIYQYDAFGNLTEKKEGITKHILYTGQQYDQETGQYYLRARYYNTVVGRFLQEDTYRGGGLNLYAYCANNPVVYYDPSGHDPQYSDQGETVPAGQADSKADFYVTPNGDAVHSNPSALQVPHDASVKVSFDTFEK